MKSGSLQIGQRWIHAIAQRPHCVAGHVKFELRNVVVNYPFESSRGFPRSEPNSGHGDHSRLSCSAGIRSFLPGCSASALYVRKPSFGVAEKARIGRDLFRSEDDPPAASQQVVQGTSGWSLVPRGSSATPLGKNRPERIGNAVITSTACDCSWAIAGDSAAITSETVTPSTCLREERRMEALARWTLIAQVGSAN